MQNLSVIMSSMSIPLITLLCLVVGYILKHWVKDVKNRLIPTVVAIVGAVAACLVSEAFTVENIVAGAISGLASTGLHQTFKQVIGGNKNENNRN